jgi:hypothetical protein
MLGENGDKRNAYTPPLQLIGHEKSHVRDRRPPDEDRLQAPDSHDMLTRNVIQLGRGNSCKVGARELVVSSTEQPVALILGR